ncbi:MAG TPA: Mur ligase family protein, partial [Candidatus Eisenbacteria bacterium]|nr:Mur ligase family protein [Candidatus Eisenbacteria bacterium]
RMLPRLAGLLPTIRITDHHMTQAEAEAYLLSFINYETLSRYRPTTRTHDLARFAAELRRLGWRPGRVPTVHVGGTNGKGTVSTLLEQVLRAGGLRTGLYTSPHLLSMRERIRLEGRPIGSSVFRQAVSRLSRRAPTPGSGFRTTFEHLTALAFLSFQDADLDVAVIEVGLGGRLDATNVLPPGPAVLTPISLDHAQILGRTVSRIATDKAHILKRGGQAYLLPQSPAAREILLKRCRREGLSPVWTAERVRVDVVNVDATGTGFHALGRTDYGRVSTRLLGAHQPANVGAVIAVAEGLLPADRVRLAVKKGLSGARVPGRLDLRPTQRGTFLLDGGHNPAAGRAMARALTRHFPGARVEAVIAMARDKDQRGYLRALESVVSAFHFTSTASPRALPPVLLERKSPKGGTVHPSLEAAIEAATAKHPHVVVIGGSFVLVADAMRLLDIEP